MSEPIKIDAVTRRKQEQASNPNQSVWVSANAGSGKTHVLSQRVIRLLLDKVEPSKILCLTYTKTAAAEMVNRVFERLSKWTALDDEKLTLAIEDIGVSRVDAATLQLARTLFARALETPGGLQIQTIHAFCTTILKRFPLEANIAGHFDMMDDETDRLLRAEAKSRLKSEAFYGGNEALTEAFETALDMGGDHAVDSLCETVLSGPQRSSLNRFLEEIEAGRIDAASIFDAAGISPQDTELSVKQDIWPMKALPEDFMRQIISDAPIAKGVSIPKFAESLFDILNEYDANLRFALLETLFLTAKGVAKSSKNLAAISHDFQERFAAAADEIIEAKDHLSRISMVRLSKAGYTIIKRLSAIHSDIKRSRGFLDYDDLIEATYRLLERDAAAAWVQYKLDQGIDHVLVDEAQDTSPRQWSIINTLTGEFFSGETARTTNRTLFVVGDEKQSIYSFQGARPEIFSQTGRDKRVLAERAGKAFEPVTMPLSFRSVPEVLQAVDAVFGDTFAQAGLTQGIDPVLHDARRGDVSGRVEVWDMLFGEKEEESDDWMQPVDRAPAPALKLANEIARVIRDLIDNGKNPATGQPVGAGDILVLVRKRDKFMHALSRDLKDLHVPVAGADRLKLTGHIAVLDLMAIARVTLQPADDLSLAALLRSPIFGFSDDELTELSAGRADGERLSARIHERAAEDPRYASVSRQLKDWRNEADFAPVHEFYARVLGRDGVRAKILARLGGEALDVIDEFMSFALASEKAGVHGLQAFVETLARAEPEIKRELGGKRNEVRIMTVHGAKGLEAPFVFLVDPGSAPVSSAHLPPLLSVPMKIGNQTIDGFFWAPNTEFRNSAVAQARQNHELVQAAEYKRLLYVGMTRAEDVLVVCGFRSLQKAKDSEVKTWIDLAGEGLSRLAQTLEVEHKITNRKHRVYAGTRPPVPKKAKDGATVTFNGGLPAWLKDKLPAPVLTPRPLTPSSLGLSIETLPEASGSSPVLERGKDEPGLAMQRGSAVHRLMEVLPGLAPSERAAAAERYVERRLGAGQQHLAHQVLAILEDAKFSTLFSSASRAEVAIGGTVTVKGEKRTVSGKIDRLVVTGSQVLIADYKTTRPAPVDRDAIPHSHIAQLALYAELLKGIYPGHAIVAALVYTAVPNLFALSPADLASALEEVTAS